MTIFNYSNLPTVTVPYILRDENNQSVGVWVTNQETKETTFCDAVTDATSFFFDGYFTVDVTPILSGITENSTLHVSAIDSSSLPIFRDIVVFSTRLDAVSDYEQNDTTGEYVFV